ncbi:MAG: hypothetical protein C3F13_02050 [Anaerolineales bacterium]|nr:zinc dependent phospholipase C family protein [Anaerolineae bacterium]PWB56344.1 MAG: hypothetical protein C3F13_02050 [Anaerolineales bacterium]
MPTPFYHLRLAEDLINHPGLPDDTREFLLSSRHEFMLGCIAPDVQVVSGQAREATHFFSLPIQVGDQPAWNSMLEEYPQIAEGDQLSQAHAAFLAGYLCHLQADWIWVKDIFLPIFGPRCSWGSFSERLYYHNVLRAYLDLQIQPGLPSGLDTGLARVSPDHWLPFIQDQHLKEWRDFVCTQLCEGAAIQSVEVLSSRQGISPPAYYALLGSKERMQEEIFSHIALEQLEAYHQGVLMDNLQLMADYLASSLHLMSVSTKGNVYDGVHP